MKAHPYADFIMSVSKPARYMGGEHLSVVKDWRNIDAALMLLAGIFVMLRNAPVGEAIWVGLADMGNWVQFTGQVPGMRTLAIVGALGLIAFGFRALLGKERGFYAGGAE